MTCEVVLRTDEVDEADWLTARRNGITGSDVLKAIGVEPSRTALWVQKIHGIDTLEETEAMRWGHTLEPVIANAWAERTGMTVRKSNVLLRSVEYPWAIVTPDYDVLDDDSLLEIKNVGNYMAHEWADEQIPLRATAQTCWQLFVAGKQRCHVAALIGGNRLETRVVERDDELIGRIVSLAGEFWHDYVEPQIMPPADGSEQATDAINALWPEHTDGAQVELNETQHEIFAEWRMVAEQRDVVSKRCDELANQVKSFLGDAGVATWGGVPLVSWKSHVQKRLDTAALKAAHPHIAEEFTRELPVRPLRALKIKTD